MTITVRVQYLDEANGINTETDERIRTQYKIEGFQETGSGRVGNMALKTAHWFCELYEADIVLAWGGTPQQLETWVATACEIEDHPRITIDGITLARTWCNSNGVVVYIAPPHRLDVLHHECIHVATGVFNSRGVGISTYEDEHLAYYSSMWFKRFYQKMKRDISA